MTARHACVLSGLLGALSLVATPSKSAADDEETTAEEIASDVEAAEVEAATESEFSETPASIDSRETPSKTAKEEEKDGFVATWDVNAGGTFNTGNTQAWTLSAGSNFELFKESRSLTISALFNFGRATANANDPNTPLQTVAKQFFARAQYDNFFDDKNGIWGAIGERWDPLSGFDSQLMVEGGYLRALIKKAKHYLALRMGYAYTYENYVAPPNGIGGSSNIHGLLAAMDYENKLNEHIEFLTTVTAVVNINEIPATSSDSFRDVRVSLTSAFISTINDRLALDVRFLLLYDRIPPAALKTDTTTIFSLVVTLL